MAVGQSACGTSLPRPRHLVARTPQHQTTWLSHAAVEPSAKSKGGGPLLDRFGNPNAEAGVVVLRNSLPEWNPEIEAYTLPFYQRCACNGLQLL